jgi:hypothetical protein
LEINPFKIIKNYDNSYYIIIVDKDTWDIVSGPYMSPDEAKSDLRILEYENKNGNSF